MCCLSPITRSRRGPPRELRNSFVARALSRQGSKCRILSVLMGLVFDRDRNRFSCFRCASDEIWTVPWRGGTGYFCNKGVRAKWRSPLVRALASMQNLESTEKIKPGQTWKVFSSVLGQVPTRLHKVAFAANGADEARSLRPSINGSSRNSSLILREARIASASALRFVLGADLRTAARGRRPQECTSYFRHAGYAST